MIPIPKKLEGKILRDTNVDEFLFSTPEQKKYGYLLIQEQKALNKQMYEIMEKASNFYLNYDNDEVNENIAKYKPNATLKILCCDFHKLESAALKFELEYNLKLQEQNSLIDSVDKTSQTNNEFVLDDNKTENKTLENNEQKKCEDVVLINTSPEKKIIEILCNKINDANTEKDITNLKANAESICKFFNISNEQTKKQDEGETSSLKKEKKFEQTL